jgi:DNA replication protein DnaC
MPEQIDPTISKAIADAERAGVVARREAVPEEAARVRRRNGLRDVMASLPEHVRKASRGDLVQRMRGAELFKAVDRWEWGNGNLVLMGSTGLGKTSAAGYLVRKLIGAGIAHGGEVYERSLLIRWQDASELVAVRREYALGDTPEPVLRCQRARLLILDDLKVVQQAELEPIDRVLSFRYNAGYPTITTTGVSSVELLRVYGDAVCRRLLECQGRKGVWVQVRAPEPEGGGKR